MPPIQSSKMLSEPRRRYALESSGRPSSSPRGGRTPAPQGCPHFTTRPSSYPGPPVTSRPSGGHGSALRVLQRSSRRWHQTPRTRCAKHLMIGPQSTSPDPEIAVTEPDRRAYAAGSVQGLAEPSAWTRPSLRGALSIARRFYRLHIVVAKTGRVNIEGRAAPRGWRCHVTAVLGTRQVRKDFGLWVRQ